MAATGPNLLGPHLAGGPRALPHNPLASHQLDLADPSPFTSAAPVAPPPSANSAATPTAGPSRAASASGRLPALRRDPGQRLGASVRMRSRFASPPAGCRSVAVGRLAFSTIVRNDTDVTTTAVSRERPRAGAAPVEGDGAPRCPHAGRVRPIEALSVAQAALWERDLPAAHLDGEARRLTPWDTARRLACGQHRRRLNLGRMVGPPSVPAVASARDTVGTRTRRRRPLQHAPKGMRSPSPG